MKLGIGVTTYNRPEVYELAMSYILRYRDDAIVAVVDDGTPNGVKVHEGTAHLRHGKNYGIAQAKNSCLALLEQHGCDYILLLDDDCFPIAPGWSEPLVAAVKASDVHCLSYIPASHVALRNAEQPDAEPFVPSMEETYGRAKLQSYHMFVAGALFFLSPRVMNKVGGFGYYPAPFGFEHMGYTKRIHRAGLMGAFPDSYITLAGMEHWFWSIDMQGFPPSRPLRDWRPSMDEQDREQSAQSNQISYIAELNGRIYKQAQVPPGEIDYIDATHLPVELPQG